MLENYKKKLAKKNTKILAECSNHQQPIQKHSGNVFAIALVK